MSRTKTLKKMNDMCIEPIANTLTKKNISGAAVGRSRNRSTASNSVLSPMESTDGSHNPQFEMVYAAPIYSLKHIDFIEMKEGRKRASNVSEAYLPGNDLQSLKPLSQFQKLKTIDASQNLLAFLCPDRQGDEWHGEKAGPAPSEVYNFMRNRWPLQMNYLLNLDLSYNRLTEIPDVQSMPNIRILKLRNNYIWQPWYTLVHAKKLELLDLRENKLAWTPKDFVEDCKYVACCRNLRTLLLEANPFVGALPNYALFVAKIFHARHHGGHSSHAPPLARVDSIMITPQYVYEAMKAELTEDQLFVGMGVDGDNGEDSGDDSGNDDALGGDDGHMDYVEIEHGHIPKMAQLRNLINRCFSKPSRSHSYMLEFVHAVDIMLSKREEHELVAYGFTAVDLNNLGTAEERTKHVVQHLEQLLMRIHILLDRQPRLQDLLLEGIAKLIGVTQYNIGDKCLSFMDYLLSSNDERQEAVIKHLETSFIPLISATVATNEQSLNLRVNWLKSLANLQSSQTNEAIGNLLAHLTSPIIKWVAEEAMPLSRDLLATIAMACRFKKNAIKYAASDVRGLLVKELRKADEGGERYLYILYILTKMTEYHIIISASSGRSSHATAQYLCQDCNVHRMVLAFLRKTVMTVARGHYNPASNKKVEGALSCLSALFHCQFGARELLVPATIASGVSTSAESMTPYLKCLRAIWEDEKRPTAFVFPNTMAAVLNGINRLLRLPHAWFPMADGTYTKSMLEQQVCLVLDDVFPILRYLNVREGKYFQRMAARAAETGGSTGGKELKVQMRQVTQIDMHTLLVSVVHIVEWYCRSSNLDCASKCTLSVSKKMDEHNRDELIFGCLVCPADVVRKEAVKCLNSVPLSQLGEDEIEILVNNLHHTRNISSGESETIIGDSFTLLTKLVLSSESAGFRFRGETNDTVSSAADDPDEARAFHEEDVLEKFKTAESNMDTVVIDDRKPNSFVAISTAFRILVQNASRDTGENHEESLEKAELTNSMIDFLLAVSSTSLKSQLGNVSVCSSMCQALYYENLYSKHFVSVPRSHSQISRKHYIPCPIEWTWTGRQIGYLMDAINGTYTENPLDPNGVVCQRIIRRMADIVLDFPDLTFEELRGQSEGTYANSFARKRLRHRTRAFHTAFGVRSGPKQHTDRHHSRESSSPIEEAKVNSDQAAEDDESDEDSEERRKMAMNELLENELRELECEADLDGFWMSTWPFADGMYQDKGENSHVHQQIRYFEEFDGLRELWRFVVAPCHTPTLFAEADAWANLSNYFEKRERDRQIAENLEAQRQEELDDGDDSHPTNGQILLLWHLMAKKVDPRNQIIVGRSYTNDANDQKESSDMGVAASAISSSNKKPPEASICADDAIRLSPLLRLFFVLVVFTGHTERRRKFVNILLQGSHLIVLANQVTQSLHAPIWYHHNVGAKYLALLDNCIRIYPDDNTAPLHHLRLYSLAFQFWSRVIVKHENDPIGFEEEAILYHAMHTCQTIVSQVSSLVNNGGEADPNVPRSTLDTDAINHLVEGWVPEDDFEALLAIFTKITAHLRDHGDTASTNHHQSSHMSTRHTRRARLIDSMGELVSLIILYATSSRRYNLLEKIVQNNKDKGTRIPETLVQGILNRVTQKLEHKQIIERCSREGIFEDSVHERKHLCCPAVFTSSLDMLAECPGNFVLTTKYVYLCYKNPAPVGNAFVAVRLEYGNIRSVYRYLLQDRICIEVGDPNVGTKSTSSRVTVEFFKQDMCNTAFHELAWFCHFHNRDEEFQTVPVETDTGSIGQLKSLLDNANESTTSTSLRMVECLSRIHMYDPEADGRYLGERVLCVTDSHLVIMKENFGNWNPSPPGEPPVDDTEGAASTDGKEESTVAVESKPLIFEVEHCHSLSSLVDYAINDENSVAAIYVGFEQMKKGDKPLELAKNSDGGIYSEAHHRYSFSFQEYVSGFIKAAHVIARHIE